MRDLFEDIFVNQPLDPTEAARRAVRPQLRRRFYGHAGVEDADGAFRVVLDGRTVMTPARRELAAPTRALAEMLAAEWEAQREVIDPATMPLTRLANSIIDGVADAAPAVAAEIEKYLGSDLVCYRAAAPSGLVARQAAAWDPVLAWARAARAALTSDIWRLGALHAITTLTGSALIALAFAAGALSLDEAWAAAHVDE